MLLVSFYRHGGHNGLSTLGVHSILISKRSQERLMAALVFCSDVHKTGHPRSLSPTRNSAGAVSVSRIPRLSLGLSS